MNNFANIEELKREANLKSPLELTLMLSERLGDDFGPISFMSCFKQAFPDIPIPTLKEAWNRCPINEPHNTVGPFNDLLEPWLSKYHESN
jgi:hypothetical protein